MIGPYVSPAVMEQLDLLYHNILTLLMYIRLNNAILYNCYLYC